MAKFQRKKSNSHQKSCPGCMGRMVSLFDLNLGVSTNKLLTEKPHRDGLVLSRNWLEISSKTLQPSEHIEDKPISHESRSSLNNVTNGTPMKMLLAQEMSKGDSKQKPPNVVARLMGLDAIPGLEPLSQSDSSQFSPVFERNKYERYSRSSKEKYHEEDVPIQVDTTPPETCIRHQRHGNGLQEKRSLPAVRSQFSAYEEEYRDVHEVRLSSTKERSNNQSLQKVSYNDNLDEKRIDRVRQKFMEAKRLATGEKLGKSKEFQDALEVLSSNRELFLEFLQEPASLFAKRLDNLQSLQSIPPQTQSKRITVLKPSKETIENGSWKQLNSSERIITSELKNDRLHRNGETADLSTKKHHLIESKGPNENEPPWTSTFDHQSICHVRPQGEPINLSHLTRIVVLKPSPRMAQDIRRVVASPLSPKPHSRVSNGSTLERFMDASADENKDLQVREITSQMHESTSCHSLHSSSAREEPLFSSVLSNGYVGDESSHSRSENERVGDNLSDSEVMTPTSRNSWDFVNRCNSYSSSLSRASYSPESSVSKEAKRRFSRRALMAHGNKERQLRRSSSTLGEMLSIPELKEATNSVGDTSEEIVGTSSSRSHAEHGNECSCVSSSKFTDFSPKRNLSRSRSVPASLRTFETLHMEDEAGKSEQPRPIAKVEKPKNAKSFKGKLSSLFFSKNQKTSKEKCDPVPLLGKAQAGKSLNMDVLRSVSERQLATTSNGSSASPLSNSHKQCITSGSSSSPIIEPKGDRSMEAISSQTIPKSRERLLENQEQPSPVSVLEPPFEDESPSPPGMESHISDHQGTRRISLLYSVAATLSSDDPNLEDSRLADRGTAEEDPATAADEHKQFLFLQKLIAAAGLDGQYPFTAAISDQWYSSNGPLYPSLVEKMNEQFKGFSATNTEDAVSGGTKLQQVWLERRLLFNCVNAALLDIGQLSLDVNPWLRTRSGTTKGVVPSGNALVEEVWRRLKKDFAVEEMVATLRAAEGRDCVDKLLKGELETTGSDWTDLQLVEIDGIGREIQNGVLNDLIEDVICDIMHSCCHKSFM